MPLNYLINSNGIFALILCFIYQLMPIISITKSVDNLNRFLIEGKLKIEIANGQSIEYLFEPSHRMHLCSFSAGFDVIKEHIV